MSADNWADSVFQEEEEAPRRARAKAKGSAKKGRQYLHGLLLAHCVCVEAGALQGAAGTSPGPCEGGAGEGQGAPAT